MAVLGAATGMRSTVGAASVILRRSRGLARPLARPAARPAAVVAVATEIVLDKLPFTGSRLDPPGLIGRAAFSALAAAALARAAGRRPLPAVLVAAGAAGASAKVAHDVRARVATGTNPTAVAVVEDVTAVALAVIGSGLATG
jgi:uncharacterized membrane protein